MHTPLLAAKPPLVATVALTVATLVPALFIAVIRGVWPHLWVRITIALLAAGSVAVSAWYLRRRVPRSEGLPMQVEQIRTSGAVDGLLALYVTPCVIAFAAPPAPHWLATAALALIGIVAARSGAVLTANPLLVVIGVHTFHARVRQLGQPEARTQNVILLSRNKTPHDAESPMENLIPVSDGVYMHTTDQAAA